MWSLLAVAMATPPGVTRPCATLERLPLAPPQRRGWLSAAAAAPGIRDPYRTPNDRRSQHFVVHWGNSPGLSDAEADTLLDALELAWRVQIDDMGHEPPYGTGTFLFNVYVGDTGDGAPAGYGAGGYQTTDLEGWPMIVVARATFADRDFLEHTAVHEFYHAVQSQTGRFAYDGQSAWYWEATAEWAAIEAVPDNPANGSFVAGYLWLPALPVNAFDYPDEGTLEEYHQYGAFLFPHDLSRTLGRRFVSDSWKDSTSNPDPLEVLRRLARDRGEDLDQLWLDHVGHNAVLDYGDLSPVLETHLDAFQYGFDDDGRFAATVRLDGDTGAFGPEEAPGRYGFSVIRYDAPDPGTVRIEIDGRDVGTRGTEPIWGGRVVEVTDDGFVYHRLPFSGSGASLDLPSDGSDLYVVIGARTERAPAWGDPGWSDERFPFDWSVTSDGAGVPDQGWDPGSRVPPAMTCDAGGAGRGPWGVLAAAAALARRRRRAR